MYGRLQDLAALAGRLAIAVVFFAHGVEKAQAGIDDTVGMMAASGVPLPSAAAVLVTGIELIGPVLFALGLALPVAGIAFAVVGIGATFFVHLEMGLTGEGGYELVLVLALASLALGFNGGRISLDHVLFGRKRDKKEIRTPETAVR